ncbi:MAG: hypothetical protein QOI22_1483, partial [Verrucomicrobiota bacterium]
DQDPPNWIEAADKGSKVLPLARSVICPIPGEMKTGEAATIKICQERGETDDAPFSKIERLKKNLFGQVERLAERREYFDSGRDVVHRGSVNQ